MFRKYLKKLWKNSWQFLRYIVEYILSLRDNDSKQNILKPLNIIYSLDKNSNKENNDKSKLILEILKKGYI